MKRKNTQTELAGCKKVNWKAFFMTLLLVLVICSPTFAQNSDGNLGELDTYAERVLGIFSSGWLKAILVIALVVEAILMVVSGQQGGGAQVFKKFAPWLIGTAIILSASTITGYFTSGMDGKFSLPS